MRGSIQERLENKITKDADGCWRWHGYRNEDGYGRMRVTTQRLENCHRVAFRIWKGEIPKGLQVLHTCDNPSCCNPDHLFLGTQRDNIDDMVAKGRQAAPSGEVHYKSKLTYEKVLEIRWLSALGNSLGSLAKKYKVSKGNINFIIQNKTWQMECHD